MKQCSTIFIHQTEHYEIGKQNLYKGKGNVTQWRGHQRINTMTSKYTVLVMVFPPDDENYKRGELLQHGYRFLTKWRADSYL